MRVLFLHGLEGRPDGRKPTAMRDAGLEVVTPDGRGMPLLKRIEQALPLLEAEERVVLAGSSYGGLAATWMAAARPEKVAGLLLCAPALMWAEPPVDDPERLVVPSGLPTHILHGRGDDIVPVSVSERLAARSGAHVRLEVLDDDHVLRASLDRIVAVTQALLEGA